MKAVIYSIFMFLFLLLGAGQTSYGFATDSISLPQDSSRHIAVFERANDKAVAVEQLTLAEPAVSVDAQQQQNQTDRFRNFSGSGLLNYTFASPIDTSYLEQSALITASCTSLVLIFPFHLFP
ncbi:hypothetical protein [Leeuwenhoekiella marinoflava]|uniref:Uncharacterized protein n=2 Tax=Leeuwenhoekiella marinoflava TaxID=988 RepID=A0A4Q0PQ48_9FLAO|nr:hypothetical protein [Leeuwenhoekiella marinoflava]RXG32614.1 hypothetical protein DSL99_390 [Leeuwenhoekiella marinoflava]SHE50777.1 hypothetical protein SAMN02745246_00449 [Leeuwenhoekiella marinoflava DSM 3653]